MTDSMIPYSFVPGMKAKAGEVNANFIALADVINQNKSTSDTNIEEINGTLDDINDTLDKELFLQKNITETDTDLNNYKRKGTYFFSSAYLPANTPKSTAGTLIVLGDETTKISQIWICNDNNPETFVRHLQESTWSNWKSNIGNYTNSNNYLILPNNYKIQWGRTKMNTWVTYPVANTRFVFVVCSKQGYVSSASNSDEGFVDQVLTGFKYNSQSLPNNTFNWIAIGM